MCNKFGHLHAHTEYSPLDGAGRVKEMVARAASFSQTFMACTDHGTASGLWEFQKACDAEGIKPILGLEFYYEYESEYEAHEFKGNGHLVVLARNNEGLRNIFKLQEYSYVHGFYRKPRINWETLLAHKEGLIVTSSCLGSTFNQLIMKGDVANATVWARKFRDAFQDDFYIELQPNQIPEQHVCNVQGIRIAKQLGIELVATNDVHYTLETDCFPHEVLLALQTNKKMDDEKRFKFDTNDFWLKTEEEMLTSFTRLDEAVVRKALSNTALIAEKCDARIVPGHFLPEFYKVPEGKTERNLLVEKVVSGAKESGFIHDEPYMREVQDEINVIDRNGYSGYFLVVQDYIESAKRNGIIVGDRGSVGGSKVAYLTGISSVEPREYDLLFERFLSDGRVPDIDADFSDQDLVFEDLQRKYGVEDVARVIAFGTLSLKNCVRKIFSAFGFSMSELSRITKAIPEECTTIDEAISKSPEIHALSKKHEKIINVIRRLEGIVSHESVHAGGVIIQKDLSSYLPIKTKRDNPTKRIVAFDKYMLEELGFQKFDILGLKTLPVIQRAENTIYEQLGIKINWDDIDFDDARVYDMLCTGDVSGVFQLDAQSSKVMEQQPRNFRDIIAINAMIRPGVGDWDTYIARRRGAPWEKDPNRPWLDETFGVIAYQEQFLLDAHHLAGWTVAYADKHIRKGWNVKDNLELHAQFVHDATKRGLEREYIESVWQEICASVGDYSFNKSHAATYGRTSFKTAYLKCYYPNHFYAALMTIEGDDQDAIAKYVAECKARGINILPPDINTGDDTFVPTNDGIRYRITTIRHVGESAIKGIKKLRPIISFDDFMEKREKKHVKGNVVDALIKAGCFDFDTPDRGELLWRVEMLNRTKTQIKNDFIPERVLLDDLTKARYEHEVLGLYLSYHPMERYSFQPLASFENEGKCLIGGQITSIEARPDKKGKTMAFVTIDTLHGSTRVLVFAYIWAREDVQSLFTEGAFVMIRGKRSGDACLFDSGEVL